MKQGIIASRNKSLLVPESVSLKALWVPLLFSCLCLMVLSSGFPWVYFKTLSSLLMYLVIFDWMWDIMLKSERQFETRMVVPLFPMFASGCSPHPGQAQNSTSFPPSHMSQESFAQLSASAVPPRTLWQPYGQALSTFLWIPIFCLVVLLSLAVAWLTGASDGCVLRFCLIITGVLRRRAGPNCPVLHWRKGTMISALPQLRFRKAWTSEASYLDDFCLFLHIFEHGGLNLIP